ncbi:MAG TPA: hypothetical protein VK750_03605, partial [Cytophagaceae bacterium]|nr:hypothetical protein [Cytophagaceae bacterium]
MVGYRFTEYIPPKTKEENKFDDLLKIFLELVTMSGGDVAESLSWLTNLDKQYHLTDKDYGIGNFIDDLKSKGYISEVGEKGEIKITPKSEQKIRTSALDEIFGKLKKSGKGNHSTNYTGIGDEQGSDHRA